MLAALRLRVAQLGISYHRIVTRLRALAHMLEWEALLACLESLYQLFLFLMACTLLLLSQWTWGQLGRVFLGMLCCDLFQEFQLPCIPRCIKINLVKKSTSFWKSLHLYVSPNSLWLNSALFTWDSPLEFYWDAAMVRVSPMVGLWEMRKPPWGNWVRKTKEIKE